MGLRMGGFVPALKLGLVPQFSAGSAAPREFLAEG